jgi:transcription antitermination factor NusG
VNWYALSIAPQREAQAVRRLAESGLTIYYPVAHLVRRKHRLSKLRVIHGVPMLAGYLFVGFNEDEQPAWSQIAEIDLVTGVVGAGGEPLVFPARDMAWLAFSSQRRRGCRSTPAPGRSRSAASPVRSKCGTG